MRSKHISVVVIHVYSYLPLNYSKIISYYIYNNDYIGHLVKNKIVIREKCIQEMQHYPERVKEFLLSCSCQMANYQINHKTD